MDFFEKFKINKQTFLARDYTNFTASDPKELRVMIVKRELNDFETLKKERNTFLNQLKSIEETILKRYQIEARNSFSVTLSENYQQALLNLKILEEFLQDPDQDKFYDTRIDELTNELNAWDEQ